MEATSEDNLDEVIRLKRHLYQLKIRGEISLAGYTQLNCELDFLSYSFVGDVDSAGLPELISRLAKRYPDVRFSVLEPVLTKQRIELIRDLRTKALAAGHSHVHVSSLFSHITDLPLHRFSWRETIARYQALQAAIKRDELTGGELLEHCAQIFGTTPDKAYFFDGASLRKNIFRQLIVGQFITEDTVELFQRDEDDIRNALNDREQDLQRRGAVDAGGVFSVAERYQYLQGMAGSDDVPAPIVDTILQWCGPDLHQLLQKLLTKNPRSQVLAELVLVRTGIHPHKEADQWRRWLVQEQNRLTAELSELSGLIKHDRLLYDTLHLLSLNSLSASPQALVDRWLPVAKALAEQRYRQLQVQQQPRIRPAIPPTLISDLAAPAVKPQFDRAPEPVEFAWEVDDDVETLNAPQARPRQDDRTVEKFSSWNKYVKPFLSENWLGLIGIGFIMAAWPILSMLVWNLGEYYRLAAGAVPLLFITMGSGWITHFFSQLNNPNWKLDGSLQPLNRKPVQLFSCLTLWSLPFNVLMAVSMIDAGNFIVGTLLFLIYVGAMVILAPWLRAALGVQARRYLLLSHGLLLLPVVVKLVAANALGYGLAALVYGVFLLLAQNLWSSLKTKGLFGLTFAGLLYGGHGFLGVVSAHIFYHQLPAIGTAAVLCELSALSILYVAVKTRGNNANVFVAAGALTLLGLLFSFADVRYFPVVIPLSAIFWLQVHFHRQKRHFAEPWFMEVFAVHPVLFAISLYGLFGLSAVPAFGLACLVVAALVTIENKLAKQELKILSWGLPVALPIAALVLGGSDWISLASFTVLIFAGMVNYRRACQLYHTALWFTSVLILVSLPLLFFNGLMFSHPAILTGYLALVCVGWSLGSLFLRGGLVNNHATTMGWLLTAVAGVAILAIVADFNFAWLPGIELAMLAVAGVAVPLAKRSQSSLPIYFAALLCGTLFFSLKLHSDLHSSSGLGSAIFVLVAIYLAPLLQGLPYFAGQGKPDRFFNRPFFFSGERFLQAPIEHIAWLVLVVSTLKAVVLFAPASSNIKLLVAYALQGLALISLANRYRLAWLAAVALLPATLFVAAIGLSFPGKWQPVYAMVIVVSIYYLNRWLQQRDILNKVLQQPMALAQLTLGYLFIPAALIGYGLLLVFGASPWIILAFGLLCLFYTQAQFVGAGRHNFVHLAILHLALLWCLAFVHVFSEYLTLPLPLGIAVEYSLYALFGLFTLVFVIAYFMEWFTGATLVAYRRGGQKWLFVLALVSVPIMALSFVDFAGIDGPEHGAFTLGYGLLALHLANRYFHQGIIFIGKWLVSCLVASLFLDDILLSVIIGSYVYIGTEWMWHLSTRIPLLQLQGVAENARTPTHKIALTLWFGVVTGLVIHGLSLLTTLPTAMHPSWLFALLPLAALLYRLLRWELLSFALAGLFVYANVFVALQWLSWAHSTGLTGIHLISGALLFSLICLVILLRVIPRPDQTVGMSGDNLAVGDQ